MNLHDWIDELCDELDVEIDLDEALVLDLARDVAHQVERPAAPLTTFLLGYAAASAGGRPEEVERLAGLATALAARWDKPAGVDDDEVADPVEAEDDAVVEEDVLADED
ncbi:DUF6457 domain-containing protein [Nocardioides scoriae]|uniref:DUF6457 domain-containing protein n=1 Tax=Nocardioides scoriae TaxID=642780 RepID=UPI000B8A46F2|nr:DUF6457 domain-containing protein [Nocardioides scoriae]